LTRPRKARTKLSLKSRKSPATFPIHAVLLKSERRHLLVISELLATGPNDETTFSRMQTAGAIDFPCNASCRLLSKRSVKKIFLSRHPIVHSFSRFYTACVGKRRLGTQEDHSRRCARAYMVVLHRLEECVVCGSRKWCVHVCNKLLIRITPSAFSCLSGVYTMESKYVYVAPINLHVGKTYFDYRRKAFKTSTTRE